MSRAATLEQFTALAPEQALDRALEMFRSAERGDKTAGAEVQRLLDRSDAALPPSTGLAHCARDALARLVGGKNLLRHALTTREIDQWSAELLGPDPTPLERMLVERVVFGRVQVLDAEIRLANCSLEDWDFYQRRLDHAHRRYMAAHRMLDTVRRKLPPVLQLNIAQKQVNVAPSASLIREDEAPAEPALPARQEPRPPEPRPQPQPDNGVAAAPAQPPVKRPGVMLRPLQLRRFGVAGLPERTPAPSAVMLRRFARNGSKAGTPTVMLRPPKLRRFDRVPAADDDSPSDSTP